MRYQLIAVDLDGTLLDPSGEVSRANVEAIAAAQARGVKVVPCTGRAWHEAQHVLKDVPGLDVGIFITGACIANVETGSSVDLALIEPRLALEIVELLAEEPEAVLVFRESALAGHHYLVTGQGELTENTQWWFDLTGAAVKFQKQVEVEDLRHTLRVGMVARGDRTRALEQKVREALGDKVQVHSFAALKRENEQETVAVLEVFAGEAHKWRGVQWVAAQHGIAREAIAVMGDDVNDLPMLREAGLGIAMGNATEVAKRTAARVTRTNAEDGVAAAIEKMLAGEW